MCCLFLSTSVIELRRDRGVTVTVQLSWSSARLRSGSSTPSLVITSPLYSRQWFCSGTSIDFATMSWGYRPMQDRSGGIACCKSSVFHIPFEFLMKTLMLDSFCLFGVYGHRHQGTSSLRLSWSRFSAPTRRGFCFSSTKVLLCHPKHLLSLHYSYNMKCAPHPHQHVPLSRKRRDEDLFGFISFFTQNFKTNLKTS